MDRRSLGTASRRMKKSRLVSSVFEQLESRTLLSVPAGWGIQPAQATRDAYFGRWYATDSASAATAMATGYKTDEGNIAWKSGDPANGALTTIAEQLRAQKGYAIGVTSTVPFNHATPAAFVSHNISRNNYRDGKTDKAAPTPAGLKNIAEEIITQVKPDVVIGGGDYAFDPSTNPYASAATVDLIKNTPGWNFVERTVGIDGGDSLMAEARTVKLSKGQRLFGLYGGPGGSFDYHNVSNDGAARITVGNAENPTMADEVNASIKVLGQNPNGFFAMFEQGDIDWANHENNYKNMIGGMWDLNQAVKAAETAVDRGVAGMNWNNTLIIVTSDHSNSYMRLNDTKPLGKGQLPEQVWVDSNGNGQIDGGEWTYPGGEVAYSTTGHTSELVSLYARGEGANLFDKYKNRFYPGTQLVDDTQIYDVMAEAAKEGVQHVMLFIGDGMNIAHEVAGSRYLYGTDTGLAWQNWGNQKDGWAGFCTTWDVTTYNNYATDLGAKPYAPGNFDPTIGYDPKLGGTVPFYTNTAPAPGAQVARAGARESQPITRPSFFQKDRRIADILA